MRENKIKVQILLATLNGEKYLSDFMESLVNQEGVELSILVSDDGSVDGTLEILERYRKKFTEFKIYYGPGLGASKNFEYLFSLRDRSLPVAFADQDDIWMPRKIICALKGRDLSQTFLVYGPVQIIGSNKIYPSILESRKFGHFFGNKAMGCTQVASSEFCKIVEATGRPDDIHFDWWNFMVAKEIKADIVIPNPLVFYRIHDGNAIGIPSKVKKLKKLVLKIIHHRSLYSNEIKAVLSSQEDFLLKLETKNDFSKFINDKSPKNIFYAFKDRYFRDSFLENSYILVLLILYTRVRSVVTDV